MMRNVCPAVMHVRYMFLRTRTSYNSILLRSTGSKQRPVLTVFKGPSLPIWIQLARQQGMILRDTAVLQMNVNTFHGKQRHAREPLVSTERIMRHVVHKKAQQTTGAWSIAPECVVRCGYPVGRAQHAPIARYSVVVEVESQT